MKLAELTPRRREVVQLLARGLSNEEIALVMGITLNAVKRHVRDILDATGSSNRMRIVSSFYRLAPK